MTDSHHRKCECGAVYARSEHMVASREISSFECKVCDRTLEHWNSAWVPTYRLLMGPIRLDDR
jgi:hypothetical protein